MSDTDMPGKDSGEAPGHGVVVRAPNGDVIRYDPTGLVMRLSDKVIADIALRLGGQSLRDASSTGASPLPSLDDIDAWNVRAEGDWLRFEARLAGRQGTRGFRRHVDGGATLGDGPSLVGILGLGGPRAALANAGPPAYPHHIAAPADDIGAVGMAGIEAAPETDRLETLRECTHEALVAEALLDWQMEAFAPLPLFVTRAETDTSHTSADLAHGAALQNLAIAAGNLRRAADTMGKKASIAAVCIDYALEDLSRDATTFRDGMLATMAAVESACERAGFHHPLFVLRYENGLPGVAPDAALDGQWELAWNHGAHRVLYSAPAYMFAIDDHDRPTEEARRQMAHMTAATIAEAETWACPVLYLAECEPGSGDTIRVIAQAAGDLILDAKDPLGAGHTCGFALMGETSGAVIKSVDVARDDPKAILIKCDKPLRGETLSIAYAVTQEGDALRATGALRDGWSLGTENGPLHRWALPARLAVHGGPHGG